MADGDEQSRHGKGRSLSRDGVRQSRRLEGRLAVERGDDLVPVDLDVRLGQEAVGHHLGGAQFAAAMDDVHSRTEAGQEQGLGDGRIPASHDGDFLALEEEAVAGGAVRDALSAEFGLAVQSELPVGRTECQDHHAGSVHARLGGDRLDLAVQFELDGVFVFDLRAEALRLSLKPLHEVGTEDALGPAGEVLDLRGRHERAAGLQRPCQNEGFESSAGRVDRRSPPRRA